MNAVFKPTLSYRLSRRYPWLRWAYRLMRRWPARLWLILQVRWYRRAGKAYRIVVGANGIVPPGWLRTEEYSLNLLRESDWRRYFTEGGVEAIVAEHVWEHLTLDQARQAAQLCYQFLKPGGWLRVAVPDGLNPNPSYIEAVRPGGSGPSADDHQMLYNYQTLGAIFTDAGFAVELLEYFDEEGQFRTRAWNPDDGIIYRSALVGAHHPLPSVTHRSLILDARKVAGHSVDPATIVT